VSYCRWSSMDFKCDLYVYESSDGVVINVASNRVVEDLPPIDFSSPEKMVESYIQQMKSMDFVTHKAIGGPCDGDSWYGLTHKRAAEIVEMLGEAGYIFPETLIEDLLEDAEEEDDE